VRKTREINLPLPVKLTARPGHEPNRIERKISRLSLFLKTAPRSFSGEVTAPITHPDGLPKRSSHVKSRLIQATFHGQVEINVPIQILDDQIHGKANLAVPISEVLCFPSPKSCNVTAAFAALAAGHRDRPFDGHGATP
jgi:hypothetical protein